MSGTPNQIKINEMIDKWLTELPPKTRKSAKSDITTALNYLDETVFEQARNNPMQLLTDLDDCLRPCSIFWHPPPLINRGAKTGSNRTLGSVYCPMLFRSRFQRETVSGETPTDLDILSEDISHFR